MSQRYLRAAALVGAVHASFSFYWAVGGRALLETVGPWAVDLARARPVAAGMGLAVVAAVKLVIAGYRSCWSCTDCPGWRPCAGCCAAREAG